MEEGLVHCGVPGTGEGRSDCPVAEAKSIGWPIPEKAD